jgi:hypothetical protein
MIGNLIVAALASDPNVHAVCRRHLAQAHLLAMELADYPHTRGKQGKRVRGSQVR